MNYLHAISMYIRSYYFKEWMSREESIKVGGFQAIITDSK